MTVLRVLTLPFTLIAFSALYSISIKAPQMVETVGLVLCMALPILLAVKLTRRLA
jgi:hypothetical protein